MMDEFDFEGDDDITMDEVLLIHPDEDIKIEAIEINTNLEQPLDSDIRKTEDIETVINSNLEPALDSDIRKVEDIETDTNSNLEPALDSDIRKAEDIETDTNSNLELEFDSDLRRAEDIEIDTNSNLEHSSDSDSRKIEIDANSNLEHSSDSDSRKVDANSNLEQASDSDCRIIKTIEIDANSNLQQASDSDSGEIDDDEEFNDLEEGEIKDGNLVSKKRSDIACRFFKRGSCVFGSQCQWLHVSDSVYKMFDTNLQKKNDLLEHHSFPKPPIFPKIVLPPRLFIEPSIISVVPKTGFHTQCDMSDDTWEKGLEQARILIRQANLKKKNEECEQKKFDCKNNNNDEKAKGQYSTKAGRGNEKNSTNSSFRKENTNDEKKSNNRYRPKLSDKWVDPWRRSKSPLIRKRLRSLSGSPPSRSRKHSSTSSTSSVSSSSSEIDDIYRRPYEKKSPSGQQRSKSRSRSVSQSQRPKKRKISPKRSFNGRRNPRSVSRSFSVSPYRKRTISSRTQSRSSSSSSLCSDCQKSPSAEDKMKKISAKLDEQMFQKSPKRALESLDSDCETSEMTVSSASCTSLSSDSEADSPRRIPIKSKRSPNRNNASSYSNKATSLSNTKNLSRNRSNALKNHNMIQHKNDREPAYQRKMQPSDSRRNLNNWSFKTEPTNYKFKNTASYFSSVKKPASAPKFSGNKISGDMELLSAYQRKMQPSSNLKRPNNSGLIKTEPADSKPKNTVSYFSSVKKPASATKVSENNFCSDMELLSAYQRKKQPSDNCKNLNNWNLKTEPTDYKPKSKASNVKLVKKPASTPKVSGNKLSGDMELLFMYQGIGQNIKSNNPISKPNRTKDAVDITNKANGSSPSYNNASKVDNTPKKNMVLNLQPKCKDYFKSDLFDKPRDVDEMIIIKKETASKREQLLNKLKLIDDAIARKKSK